MDQKVSLSFVCGVLIAFIALALLSACTSEREALNTRCKDKKISGACYQLSLALREEENSAAADKMRTVACDLGHGDACFDIAMEVLESNREKAKGMLKIACNKGNRKSCDEWQSLTDQDMAP